MSAPASSSSGNQQATPSSVSSSSAPAASARQTTGSSQPPPIGLVRPRRRVIKNTRDEVFRDDHVVRNYAIHDSVVFTNFSEVKNDTISAVYAQDLIEEVFTLAGIDFTNKMATRTAEDIIFIFFVENGASIKTSYEKVFDVYGVEFDLLLLLQVLVANEVTPRRFARALSGRIHSFLRDPKNKALRVDLASRHNLDDPDDALICFDGSTHIPNISSAQRSKANMMAARGIYENTASQRNLDDRTTYSGSLMNKGASSGALHLLGSDS